MTIFWLVFLLYAAYAGNITPEENLKLKERCNAEWTVQANKYKRLQVDPSYYPFAVALSQIKETPTYDPYYEMTRNRITAIPPICSGVLISSRHILTAAHCLILNAVDACEQSLQLQLQLQLQELTAQRVGVFLGSSGAEKWWDNQRVEVASVHVHQDYENVNEVCSNNTSYDIAAIELKQDVYPSPICMPERDADTPEKLISIGYGSYKGDDSLQAVVYNEISKKKNNKAIVAFTKNKDEHAINGDSGGPIIQNLHGKHYLFGIASSWQPLGSYRVSSRFVDVREHLDWICEKTGVCPLSGDQEQPPSQYSESFYPF